MTTDILVPVRIPDSQVGRESHWYEIDLPINANQPLWCFRPEKKDYEHNWKRFAEIDVYRTSHPLLGRTHFGTAALGIYDSPTSYIPLLELHTPIMWDVFLHMLTSNLAQWVTTHGVSTIVNMLAPKDKHDSPAMRVERLMMAYTFKHRFQFLYAISYLIVEAETLPTQNSRIAFWDTVETMHAGGW